MSVQSSQPLCDPTNAKAAFDLRYTWTGWPSQGQFEHERPEALDELKPLWEQDGLRLLESTWTVDAVKLTFSTNPSVSPVLLAGRAKGRLDHAMRTAASPISFSRKVAVRSVGENARQNVEQYIARQVINERFVDPHFEARMQEFSIHNPDVDLSQPAESARGRYWYNLHLVLVVVERGCISDYDVLALLRDRSIAIGAKKGYLLSRLSVLPDHLHIALRGVIGQSPAEIAGSFQNHLAYALGQKRVWEDSSYIGTFGEYNMEAIRRQVRKAANRDDC